MAGPEAAAFNVGGGVDAMLNVEGVRHETMGPNNPIAADGIVLKATQDTAIPGFLNLRRGTVEARIHWHRGHHGS
jgi:hypothetical protein